MRLVDADKLVEICRKGWKLYGREDEKLKHWVDEDDIRNQPTVEAISVEWFEKRIKEINEAITHLYVEGCFYPDSEEYEERKNILLRRLAEIRLHGSAYDLVLNEWRAGKENEIGRC